MPLGAAWAAGVRARSKIDSSEWARCTTERSNVCMTNPEPPVVCVLITTSHSLRTCEQTPAHRARAARSNDRRIATLCRAPIDAFAEDERAAFKCPSSSTDGAWVRRTVWPRQRRIAPRALAPDTPRMLGATTKLVPNARATKYRIRACRKVYLLCCPGVLPSADSFLLGAGRIRSVDPSGLLPLNHKV